MSEPNQPTSTTKPTVAHRLAVVRRNLKTIEDNLRAKQKRLAALKRPFDKREKALDKLSEAIYAKKHANWDAEKKATEKAQAEVTQAKKNRDIAVSLARRLETELTGTTQAERLLAKLTEE